VGGTVFLFFMWVALFLWHCFCGFGHGLTSFGLHGIPFGIWSLRLLSESTLKAAFPDGPR
jgi:hypothetical protein